MKQAVIIDGIRTPIGKLNGAMKDVQPEAMAALLLETMCKRNAVDTKILDAVILGHAKQSSDQPNIARLAALMAQLPVELQAYTVHRQCGSGMPGRAQCGAGDHVRLRQFCTGGRRRKYEQRPVLSAAGSQRLLCW